MAGNVKGNSHIAPSCLPDRVIPLFSALFVCLSWVWRRNWSDSCETSTVLHFKLGFSWNFLSENVTAHTWIPASLSATPEQKGYTKFVRVSSQGLKVSEAKAPFLWEEIILYCPFWAVTEISFYAFYQVLMTAQNNIYIIVILLICDY